MKKLLWLPLLAAAVLYAQESAPQPDVRAMIEAVQNAPEGERYQKMNEFKKLIRSMNEAKRNEAISQMQKAMENGGVRSGETDTRTRTDTPEGEMTRTREQNRLQNLQQQQQQRNQMNLQQQINRPVQQSPAGPQMQGNGPMNH
jgi:hypothetical protein